MNRREIESWKVEKGELHDDMNYLKLKSLKSDSL